MRFEQGLLVGQLLQAALDARTHHFKQLIARKGFGEVVVGPQCHATAKVGTVVKRGQKHHRRGMKFGQRAQLINQREAIHFGHVHIGQDEVGMQRFRQIKGTLAVGRGNRVVALNLEQAQDVIADRIFVFNHQHDCHDALSVTFNTGS